jgi:hypothetical protein
MYIYGYSYIQISLYRPPVNGFLSQIMKIRVDIGGNKWVRIFMGRTLLIHIDMHVNTEIKQCEYTYKNVKLNRNKQIQTYIHMYIYYIYMGK